MTTLESDMIDDVMSRRSSTLIFDDGGEDTVNGEFMSKADLILEINTETGGTRIPVPGVHPGSVQIIKSMANSLSLLYHEDLVRVVLLLDPSPVSHAKLYADCDFLKASLLLARRVVEVIHELETGGIPQYSSLDLPAYSKEQLWQLVQTTLPYFLWRGVCSPGYLWWIMTRWPGSTMAEKLRELLERIKSTYGPAAASMIVEGLFIECLHDTVFYECIDIGECTICSEARWKCRDVITVRERSDLLLTYGNDACLGHVFTSFRSLPFEQRDELSLFVTEKLESMGRNFSASSVVELAMRMSCSCTACMAGEELPQLLEEEEEEEEEQAVHAVQAVQGE